MSFSVRRAIVASFLLIAPAVAQTSRPAAPPDSPDQAAARSAGKAFILSLAEDDIAVTKKLFSGTDEDFKSVEMLHDTAMAGKRLQAAIEKKFPGAMQGRRGGDLDPKAMAAKVDFGAVKIEGDTATLRDGMTLHRMNGEWKVVNLFGDERTKSMMAKILPTFAKTADEMVPEIEDGKYATFEEATKAMQTKMQAAMREVMKDMMGGMQRSSTAPSH